MEPSPLKIKAGDDDLTILLKERHNNALAVAQLRWKELLKGSISVESSMPAGWRLLSASVDAIENPKERIEFLNDIRELANFLERLYAERRTRGSANPADLHIVRQFRLDVDIQILKAKKVKGDK